MKRRAFTFFEVLVAGGIGLVVMTIGLAIFLKLSDAGRLGESWLSLQLNAREVSRRLQPLLRMATPPNSLSEGLYQPDGSSTASTVVFAVPEDVVAPTPAVFNPRTPTYYLMQVRHDATARQLLLEDFYRPERSRVLGRDVSLFSATRIDRAGLTYTLELTGTTRDARGMPKQLKYRLSDSVQLPE